MADIQQWRRMIQPTRARTPAVDHDDSDGVASPVTPKRGLKPKLSSYFTKDAGSALAVRADTSLSTPNDDWLATSMPTWPDDEPYPDPEAEGLIDSIMCRLMAEPYASPEPRFNGMLLQIFESYRTVSDEKARLQAQLDSDLKRRNALLQRLQTAQKQWSDERQDYKAEVKRLELLLAKGKRGLAEVTLARQDSLFRQKASERRANQDDGLETIFEFLEKTKRYEDKAWSGQRATFRPRQPSPSAQMRRLSKQLSSKKSMTNIHADLPFGTAPDVQPSTLAEASSLEGRVSEPKTSFSDDTLSTFSCAGDLLPDETADVNLIEAAGTDNDFVAIKRIANVLARRRNVDPSSVMPKLCELFDAGSLQSLDAPISTCRPTVRDSRPQVLQPTATDKTAAVVTVRRYPSLMAKASGFFHKLRPQLNVDTTCPSSRRKFSFEAGDDTVAISLPGIVQLSGIGSDRVLRKSSSLPSLAGAAQRGPMTERTLSPVAQSPTTSAPLSESRRASKIPTPVYSPIYLARPRQEREDSTSSLLTAIKFSDSTRRSDSVSGSNHSSPSTSRADLGQRAVLHTRPRTPRVKITSAVSLRPDMSEACKENIRPMICASYLGDEEGSASP